MNTPNPYIDSKKPHVILGIEWLDYVVPEWKTAVCLTGMRPSWQLHLGHYVGALENWLKIQEMSRIKCQFLIADYHVMWDQDDMEKIRKNIYEVIKDWLAVGRFFKELCFRIRVSFQKLGLIGLYNLVISYIEHQDHQCLILWSLYKNQNGFYIWH